MNIMQRKHQMKSIDMFGIFPHHRSGLEERFMEVYSGSRVHSSSGPHWTWLHPNQLFWHCSCKETVYHWRQERARDLGFKETYKVLTFGEGPRERGTGVEE